LCSSDNWPRVLARRAVVVRRWSSVALVRLVMRLGHGALFTLMAHRSCDSRDSDLAVARIEVCVVTGGGLLLLRWFRTHRAPILPCASPSTHCVNLLGRNCAANRVLL